MYLVTSEQMQSFDRHAIDTLGVPGIVLMDHAGRAVARAVRRRRPRRVVVLCGKGNNGGDGWVAARWLRHWGIRVDVVTLADPDELRGDAATAAKAAVDSGVPYTVLHRSGSGGPGAGQPLDSLIAGADVCVDALLGTGASRPPEGLLAAAIEALNRHSPWTVAVDVPTGVNASTGEVPGVAVRAHETVCMATQKLGTAVSPGCYYAGRVRVADIGIPVAPSGDIARWTTAADIRETLPQRSADSHKGTFGRVGIAAGEMRGAAALAGLGALRAGAGLVVVAVADDSAAGFPYEFVLRHADGADGAFDDCQSLVVGPGLGRHLDRWRERAAQHRGTGVLDADALRWIVPGGGLPDWLQGGRWVLTPHPKECARMLGWHTAEVQAKRLSAVRTLARETGCVVVLKGHHSLIADASGRLRVNPTGDASLATAGTGDVLAGVIGGLLAQGLEPFEAAAAGAWLHGLAGELAGRIRSRTGVIASDVVDCISRAIHLAFDTNPGGIAADDCLPEKGEVDYAKSHSMGCGVERGGGGRHRLRRHDEG
ncbi:MAG: NAD(P)H-hydrate dehydratase [Alicyclobacillaceae bacterium]|nr:NAD(P)H-hydrate dehydratase [Alicyclobacillaceae bacterium]